MESISIARDFTPFPGGRYRKNGKGSGEEFRTRFLLPSLQSGRSIVVDLDGTSGYPSSFLEEAFGGLVREGFSPAQVRNLISVRASSEFAAYADLIWQYVSDAAAVQHA